MLCPRKLRTTLPIRDPALSPNCRQSPGSSCCRWILRAAQAACIYNSRDAWVTVSRTPVLQHELPQSRGSVENTSWSSHNASCKRSSKSTRQDGWSVPPYGPQGVCCGFGSQNLNARKITDNANENILQTSLEVHHMHAVKRDRCEA